MRGKTMKKAMLAITLIVSLGSASQAAVTITSTVQQSGVERFTSSTPMAITVPGGWNFTTGAYNDLTSIDAIAITLTLKDADTGLNEFDYNKLSLSLDGIGTGLMLNGFGNNATTTLTLTSTSPSNSAAILAALKLDGKLMGTLVDASYGDNNIGIPDRSVSYHPYTCTPIYTTLSITGQEGIAAVPAPGAVLLCGLGTSLVGWLKRRRTM